MKTFLLDNLWAILFVLFVFGVYEQSSQKVARATARLEIKAAGIQEAITKAEALQNELRLQVANESDPATIELALIKGLGLVPEGYRKIFFQEKNTPEKEMQK
jgi:hypothetical protein